MSGCKTSPTCRQDVERKEFSRSVLPEELERIQRIDGRREFPGAATGRCYGSVPLQLRELVKSDGAAENVFYEQPGAE